MLKRVLAGAAITAALVASASCSSTSPPTSGVRTGSGGGPGSAGATGSSGQTGSAGSGIAINVPDPGSDAASCSASVSCTPLGGQYCGSIGDGCNGTLDCGMNCKTDWSCENSVCVGGASCVPAT